jgi:hypothetical protein
MTDVLQRLTIACEKRDKMRSEADGHRAYIVELIAQARQQGEYWQDIGAAMGISRQDAERFGKRHLPESMWGQRRLGTARG